MPAQLTALHDGPSILLDKPILLLGRHPECDVQIDSRKISRRHCCIAQVNDYLVVRDLGSTNGIRINGVRVIEGKLKPGDELTIGNYRYKVTWDGAAAPPPQAPPAKPAARARRQRHEEDLLESLDEPIPLAEPEPHRGPPGKPPPRPPARDDDPLRLPDNLELLPGSGQYPNPSSHH
jgi:pSer/pThr/pTyr-binding forkhead associated (FHA) protein